MNLHWPNARRVTENRLLLLAIVTQVALVIVRTLNLYVTGFMTSDEQSYVLYSMAGKAFTQRYFFEYMIINLFKALDINSITKFMVFFPFYAVFWGIVFIFLAFKITALVSNDRETSRFTAFSVLFLWTYALLSVGFVTETVALALCALGVYSWLRFIKVARRHYLLILANLAFVAAALTHEPYAIFAVAGISTSPLLVIQRKLRRILYLCVVVPVAVAASLELNKLIPVVSVFVNLSGLQFPAFSGPSSLFLVLIPNAAVLLSRVILLFLLGLLVGWNPILLAIGGVGFALLVRRTLRGELPFSLAFFAVLSLSTFFLTIVAFANNLPYFEGRGLSTLLRFSSPTIISYLLVAPTTYQKLSANRKKLFALILLVFTITSFGVYSQVTQSAFNLPYNPVSFSQETGPLLGRQYFLSHLGPANSTTIFLSWEWKAGELFIYDIPEIHYVGSNLVPRNYCEDKVFASLRPSEFYVFSAGTLDGNFSDSVATMGFPNFPVCYTFLLATFSTLYNGTYVPSTTAYRVNSVTIVFNSPTGYLLRVNVGWAQTSTA